MARHAACLRLNFAMLDLLFALLDRELTLAKPNIGFPLFSLAWIGCVGVHLCEVSTQDGGGSLPLTPRHQPLPHLRKVSPCR